MFRDKTYTALTVYLSNKYDGNPNPFFFLSVSSKGTLHKVKQNTRMCLSLFMT